MDDQQTTWPVWLHGLMGAGVAAAAAGVGAALVVPGKFTVFTLAGLIALAKMIPFPAMGGCALYLAKSPVPSFKRTVTVQTQTEVHDK